MCLFKRICEQNHGLTLDDGSMVEVVEGHTYITGDNRDGHVMVFNNRWFEAPVSLFSKTRILIADTT